MCYNMSMEVNFILPENFRKQSVKHFLSETLLVPRKLRYFLRLKKHFLVNEQMAADDLQLKAGDRIQILFDHDDFPELVVENGQANLAQILYEDDWLVIANKPEGMKTHPNQPGELGLQNHVAAKLNQPVYVVHRLDVATSGAVLFAKNQFILPILSQMFEKNQIHRQYEALVCGHFPTPEMTFDGPIGRNRHEAKKFVVTKNGKPAVTHLTVMKTFARKNRSTSLVQLNLETGRTHQIRVHLSNSGHSIIGDSLYGQPNQNKKEARMMLHARKIILPHPILGKTLEILAPNQTFDARCQQEEDNQD